MKNVLLMSFLSFALMATVACQKKERTLEETLQKSVEWIWSQQSPDGGWHSKTHAVLRDGRVLTPYILFYLLQVQDEVYQPEKNKIDNAVDFITSNMQTAFSDDSNSLVDYPNYSAAYALRVLHFLKRDSSLQSTLAKYLLQQQFIEHRGFGPDSLAYGGWGYGEGDLKVGQHGHVDISHTRRVAEALIEAGYIEHMEADAKAKAKEKIFLFIKGVQRSTDDNRLYDGCISRQELPYDGGFVASVVTLSTTKSIPVEIDSAGVHYPSYATATCDGFMTLHALDKDGAAYTDAKKWLIENQNMHTIDGLSPEDPGQWAEIMHYYHLAVRAEAMSLIEPNGEWKDSIKTILQREQLPEGYFVNPIGGINKEDDPLMATIFCIQVCHSILSGKR